MHDTLPLLIDSNFPSIARKKLETLQVNLGYKCNQQCLHCHVNASPARKEMMSLDVIDSILKYMQLNNPKFLDLTGGAPELNPHFKYLVTESRKLGIHIIDRCNLSILLESEQQELAQFLTDNNVEIIASLPCYEESNVDGQRGKGIFQKSITALNLLNSLGYGQHDINHQLNLVYNPTGPYLPPSQVQLETDYKKELQKKYGIVFNQLFTITNVPIKRFGSMLISKGEYQQYMSTLKDAYSSKNLESVMCRSLISINWQGYLYDCDFNQMLDLPLKVDSHSKTHIKDIMDLVLEHRNIMVADHCYACTAGQGSSCGGALND
ncbi:Radical SAM domain protein [hydrothermal vent metagenome]|uniref:Radical SAM domain protein n=1 Tax=hydrothermal vent metagenome TaxID=652676 RepID=A0A3B0ZZ60_9ZZZZ